MRSDSKPIDRSRARRHDANGRFTPHEWWRTKRATLAAAALAGALLATAWLASAEPLDPTLAHRFVVGAPAGPAPMDRLGPTRAGRTRGPLPDAPRVLWRTRVPGTPAHSLAVDAHGAVVVASSTHLSQLSRRGQLQWSHRFGVSHAATGPVITSGGARWVVTWDAEVVSIDAAGHQLWRRALPVSARRSPAPPLPTADGGAIVAVGSDLFQLEPDGRVRSQSAVDESVASVLGQPDRCLAVTNSGRVWRWAPPAAPTEIGTFGEPVTAGPALDRTHRLLAVLDNRRLVELDLRTGARRIRVAPDPLRFDGAPALTAQQETRLLSVDGLLVGYDARGGETLRVALEADSGQPPTGSSAIRLEPSADPVVDDAGRVAFARAGRDVGVVTADGKVMTAPGSACPSPVSLAPAGRGRLVLSCRCGLVWMFGQ